MESYVWINSLGLVLDIIGVLLLFRYGLPIDITNRGILGISQRMEKQKDDRRYLTRSYIGLSLLIIGFILQIVSNFIK